MISKTPLFSLHYFPCLEFFVALTFKKQIIIEAYEHYQKQSYRNRCYILGSNKILNLTIPVLNGNEKGIVKDVRIDYGQKWLNVHWRSVSSAYGKSPFFLFYGDFFYEILFKKHRFLFDLNLEILQKVLEILNLKIRIEMTESYQEHLEEDVLDLRGKIHPKNNFKNNGIYKPCRYNQIFGSDFVTNLSIIDLLLCEGNNAVEILTKSSAQLFQDR